MGVVAFMSSIYSILVGNLDTSTWVLPFSLISPCNAETIWGWYFLFCMNCCILISYAVCISTTTSYFISGCLYIGAIYDHFNTLIDSLKDDFQPVDATESVQPMKFTQKMHESVREKLHAAVEINVKLFE